MSGFTKQDDMWEKENEATIKAHILCKRNGFGRPVPSKYLCPFEFIKDDKKYSERFDYYFNELMSQRMQVL